MKSASSASDTYSGPDLRMLACISAHIIIALTFNATCSRGSHHDAECAPCLSHAISLNQCCFTWPSPFEAQPCCLSEEMPSLTSAAMLTSGAAGQPALLSSNCHAQAPSATRQRAMWPNSFCGNHSLCQVVTTYAAEVGGRCSQLCIAGPAQTSSRAQKGKQGAQAARHRIRGVQGPVLQNCTAYPPAHHEGRADAKPHGDCL